jgi:AAA+ lid domain
VADDIDLRSIAFETAKYTGAQLANLVNTAGGFVGKEGRDVITTADLQHVRGPSSGLLRWGAKRTDMKQMQCENSSPNA